MILNDFLVMLSGIAGGFCSSAPLGVINLWITDAVLDKKEDKITWFVLGVVLADMAHAALASWGYHSFLQDAGLDQWIAIFGGAFVVVMGLLGLWHRRSETASNPNKKPKSRIRHAHQFILGLIMCGANPGFFVFWMFLINLLERRLGIIVENRNLGIFLLGLSIGDALWFAAIIGVARRGREYVQPKTIRIMRTMIACAFIGVGSVAIIKTF